MFYYTLQVGLTTADQKKIPQRKGVKIASKIISEYIADYTISKCVGFWKLTREKSLKIEILHDNDIDFIIDNIVRRLNNDLQQNCIMLSKHISNTQFILRELN